MKWRIVKGEKEDAMKFFELLKENVVFLFTIGNTKTAEIPGITVAGANPELIKYTPPADVELLYYGKCKSIDAIPATPDGKPTPALITYTSLRLTQVPFFVVDSGLMVKPKTPYISIGAPVGGNIKDGQAMSVEEVKESFERAKKLGEHMSKLADILVIGESIPAGTTTAGAVLKAFGVKDAVSSSMPSNPVELKRSVIEEAVKRVNSSDVFDVVAEVGDPVMVGVAGIAVGSSKPVLLAGGTQMAAIAHIIKKIDESKDIAIATTVYVADDDTADIAGISPVTVMAADPGLGDSVKPGLRAYAEGFVKEGVGAGGATLLSYARGFSKQEFLKEIEKDYECIVEFA
ncbi:nicotinate mononucleotide-dependent phosphoribosyltransferase CobT [Archaeoglobus veneficus]|uniref:UPF0284 protein Arcve_1549 n=1 Tax=Archaeoglobus veneficus (strain DSM 11195 / SNP6) TaxID=693661 RepID=F2KPM3_ARCVS|nr:TIGR00303 family protein [Archaeoglobus veneficus]AEA47551.1 UPF0284 protein [Archaeoglobus veneficus SNP6]